MKLSNLISKMNEKAYGLLGLARRAHKVVLGETVLKKIRTKTVYLLILSEEIGRNNQKKLTDKCSYYQIPYVSVNEAMINKAIGSLNHKYIGITDQEFACALYACLKGKVV